MINEQAWLMLTSALALVSLLVALLAGRRATRADARARALADRLALLESLATPASATAADAPEAATPVITRIDEEAAAPPAPVEAQRLEGRLFADIVAREAVVTAASWTRGLRRALAPETRNLIRFQVRQETRRAGRERKAEVKVAVREHRARSRAAATDLRATLGEDVA